MNINRHSDISTLEQPAVLVGEASEARRPALERLTQPMFFSGQLLTDQDLMTFLRWVQDKQLLTRQAQGWGVICGLDVTAHPRHAGEVLVRPGYARTAAGDDVVVTEATALDLAPACAALTAEDNWTSQAGERPPETVILAGFTVPTENLRVIDVAVHYREQPAEPQAPLGGGPCAGRVTCEYSRIHESFSLTHSPALVRSSPVDDVVERWRQRFERAGAVVEIFLHEFPWLTEVGWSGRQGSRSGGDAAEGRRLHGHVRRWLLNWIAAHPLFQLSWIYDRIQGFEGDELSRTEEIVATLFWLVQDARLRALAPGCGYDDPPGVPLARVWMNTEADTGAGDCRVLLVDARPPFKRPLALDAWPAPLGQVNLAQVLLERWPSSCTRLTDLGVEVAAASDAVMPSNVDQLHQALNTELFAPLCPDDARPLIVHLLDAGPLGLRVVGIEQQPEVLPELGLAVAKVSDRDEARTGEPVSYTYTAINTGEEPLVAHLMDSLYGPITPAGGLELAPGDREEIRRDFEVPADAPRQLVTRVDATGEAGDGRKVEAAAEHLLKIADQEPQLGLKVDKRSGLASAYPYQWVTYTYQVENSGEVDLEVMVRDSHKGAGKVTGKKPKIVESATLLAFQKRLDVPGDARGVLATTVKASGEAEDGRKVDAEFAHSLRIQSPDDLTLVGMMQAKAHGQLVDATRAYKAQIFTFERFASLPTDHIYKVYAWTFQSQQVKSTALVELWQKLAADLARTRIRQAADVVATSDEELRRLFPDLSRRRRRIFKKRAQKRVEKGKSDWVEDADEEPSATPTPDEPKPAPAPVEPEPAPAEPEPTPEGSKPPAEPDDFSPLMNTKNARRLQAAGIRTFGDLIGTDEARLKQLSGVSQTTVRRWKRAAAKAQAGG